MTYTEITDTIYDLDPDQVIHVIETAASRVPQNDAIRAAIRGIISRRFDGPTKPMTDQDWNDLLDGKYQHPLDKNSLALPRT